MSARLPFRTLVRAAPRVPLTRPVASVRWASEASSSKSADVGKAPAKAPATEATEGGSSKVKGKVPKSRKDKDDKDVDPYAVPPLSRPLGVGTVPSSSEKTWEEKRADMLDRERHLAKRRALFKQASQGYFHDYNLARKANGGKLWVAPNVLIREDRALYFPDITGKALTGQTVHTTDLFKGKVSLVTILNTRISEEHVQSFVEPVLEDWEGQPHFSYVQINHQENPLKSMLLSFFVSSLKRTIPEERWGTYMIATGEWSELDITGPMGLENKLLGYVFLVDENAKVRWAGCGSATREETDSLRRAAAVLIRRMAGEGEVATAGMKA